VRWVDVGCGSGALTFATWEYLRHSGFGAAEVVGVELRPALAEKAERIARQLGCEGLSFVAGEASAVELGAVDGVVALHACDTATDEALARGVLGGARWLLVAPCCHRELRPQLTGPPALAPALRHGILRTREAEIATDALRAAVLEARGFEARVFEFVSSEHTDKNLMIAATRRGEPQPGASDAVRELARHYGVTRQRLAERLGVGLAEIVNPRSPPE
jgi:SAM-dependent methyltransferase